MSGTRYLELDSTYRNRQEDPNPASFTAQISETGNSNSPLELKDPISDATPTLYWNSSFNESSASTSVSVTGIDLTNATSDPYIFLITGAQNTLRNITGYYNGAVLQLTDNNTPKVTVLTRITCYQLISSTASGDIAQVTVFTALPSNFPFGGLSTGTIQNPTENTATALIPKIFVPAGQSSDNYYINYVVQYYDPTTATPLATTQTRTITYYDGVTHLATLSGNTTVSWLVSNGDFIIRKVAIATSGNIIYPISTTTNTVQLDTTASNQSGAYTGSFLRMLTPFPIASAHYSVVQGSYGSNFKIGNYIAGNGTIVTAIVAGATNTFTLNPQTSSSITGYYVGGLLTLDYGAGTQETLLVTSYAGSTRSGTVVSNWANNHLAGASWLMRTVILASAVTLPVAQAPQTTNLYEIDYFTRDSWTPFSYNGSLVSSQESVCYEVELVNLVLPNSTLASGRGGRTINYPYLYVKLEPKSASANNKGIIYSNNPNAFRQLFRCVVDDTTTNYISPFIKIDSDSMAHNMKFKPNDSFFFAVYLPDGSLFQTVAQDSYSPSAPNPLVQISACFSFKRGS